MSVGLYMDENVPRSIVLALRQRGVDVMTAQEDGRAGTADDALLARATELGRVMFSHDADMLRVAEALIARGIEFSGIAYARPMSITIGQAVEHLQLVAQTSEPHDMINRVQYLPL